jgi:hypothetical protein
LAAAVFMMIAIVFWPRPPAIATAVIDMSPKMAACRADAQKSLGTTKLDIASQYQVSGLCYSQIRGEFELGDFAIRRSALIDQLFETLVIMWMVVAITISGVVLAGVQLAAAYSLASLGKGEFAQPTEMSLKQGRISVQSSITGLLILTVSLAFFVVFVKFVYKLEVVNTSRETESLAAQAPAAISAKFKLPQLGGYGTVKPTSEPAAASAEPAGAGPASNATIVPNPARSLVP